MEIGAMAYGRNQLGTGIGVQGNVDLAYIFSPLSTITEEIQRVAKCWVTWTHSKPRTWHSGWDTRRCCCTFL